MKGIVIATTLLAGFALPAFAEDVTVRADDTARMTAVEPTPAKTDDTAAGQTIITDDANAGCMRRHKTALNMM